MFEYSNTRVHREHTRPQERHLQPSELWNDKWDILQSCVQQHWTEGTKLQVLIDRSKHYFSTMNTRDTWPMIHIIPNPNYLTRTQTSCKTFDMKLRNCTTSAKPVLLATYYSIKLSKLWRKKQNLVGEGKQTFTVSHGFSKEESGQPWNSFKVALQYDKTETWGM